MSGGLVPSKSTVYVSNLPYGLRNNDIHKLFEKHGRIVKVSVLKEKQTRRSKGVAFVLYLNREDASKCVKETNEIEMFGRTLKASIAKDNGRAAEFIRRKEYPDKTRCFECGEFGHLSYKCEKNLLGERDVPVKRTRKRKRKQQSDNKLSDEQIEFFASSESDSGDEETLSSAIAKEQEKQELEDYRYRVATGNYLAEETSTVEEPNRKIIKKSAYFSDEEDSD